MLRGKSRRSSARRRRATGAGVAAAIALGLTGCAHGLDLAATPGPGARPAPTLALAATPADPPSPTARSAARPQAIATGGTPRRVARAGGVDVHRMSPSTGGVGGGDTVTVRGTGLDAVSAVTVRGVRVALSSRSAAALTFRMPAAEGFAPGAVRTTLVAADGTALDHGSYTYRVSTGVDRQLRYVLRYWKDYNPAWEALADNDCVDFASQGLLERGWQQQGNWTHAESVLDSGAAWRSSTALRDFLEQHPELATPLSDDQRERVKPGDIVQFDWDGSGDRDHTGTVTRVTRSGGTTRVYFAGHTQDSDYRSVDTAITVDHPGGRAYYWSIRD